MLHEQSRTPEPLDRAPREVDTARRAQVACNQADSRSTSSPERGRDPFDALALPAVPSSHREIGNNPLVVRSLPESDLAPTSCGPKGYPPESLRPFDPRYLLRDTRETIESILGVLSTTCDRFGLSPVARVSAGVAFAAGAAAAFALAPLYATGLTAVAFWKAGMFFEKNRHSRVTSLVAGSAYTSHMHELGLSTVALCSFSGTLRGLVQGMLADDRPMIRAGVAIAAYAGTVAVYTLSGSMAPLDSLENIPIVVLGLGTMSGAFSERFSWASRLTNFCATGLSLGFHVTCTLSPIGIYLNLNPARVIFEKNHSQ